MGIEQYPQARFYFLVMLTPLSEGSKLHNCQLLRPVMRPPVLFSPLLNGQFFCVASTAITYKTYFYIQLVSYW